jgi:hypothetical protein
MFLSANLLLEKATSDEPRKKSANFIRHSYSRNEQSFRLYISSGISLVIHAFRIVICRVLQ